MPLLSPSPYARTKPPVGARIDWSDPLAPQLSRCWAFNEGAGMIATDLVYGDKLTCGPTPQWQATPNGHGISYVIDGLPDTGWLSSRPNDVASENMSVFALVGPYAPNEGSFGVADSNNGFTILSNRQADADKAIIFSLANDSTRKGVVFGFDTTGAAQGAISSTALTIGRMYAAGGTFLYSGTGTFGGTWKTYLNGLRDGTDNNMTIGGTVSFPFGSTKYSVCSHPLWGGGGGTPIICLYIWRGRVLSPQEMLRLYNEPFCILRGPDVIRRYF